MIGALSRALRFVLIGLMAAMTCIVALQVVLRYFFDRSLSWGEEMTRYLFIYLIFLGAAHGIHFGIHVSIDALIQRLPARTGKLIDAFARVLVGGFLVFLVFYGVSLALDTMGQRSPALGVPIGLAYLAIPVGALLGLAFLFGRKERATEEMLA